MIKTIQLLLLEYAHSLLPHSVGLNTVLIQFVVFRPKYGGRFCTGQRVKFKSCNTKVSYGDWLIRLSRYHSRDSETKN